ncbi:MAG: MerR family transcriptional regulator [Chitinophagaceae bacterium]|nr:MerR family transcriptional regulator [Chitinophagaceae bacterium]
MAKKVLTQIAFDFGAPPEPVEEQKPVQPMPPPAAIIEVEPEITLVEFDEPVVEEEAAPAIHTTQTKQTAVAKSTRGRRSLKANALNADLVNIPDDETLFQKSYYSIGEVARMFRENQSLIRYWETEFDILKPRKNKKGDRFFRPVDVKNLELIYDLLRRRKFTIEGAKDYLKKNKKAEEKFAMIRSLEKIKAFFLELKATL